MRRKLAAGNWKMNGTKAALSEIKILLDHIPSDGPEVLICPPATLLSDMATLAEDSALACGGQDCHVSGSGAHTGDISAAMLRDAGADYVILGHSERRADHGENDALVRAKALAAWQTGLHAIICVGETEAERDAANTLGIIAG
ncbi:MAG: triose-phosphate isomerase, partial [Pseudomonadota bacterium]